VFVSVIEDASSSAGKLLVPVTAVLFASPSKSISDSCTTLISYTSRLASVNENCKGGTEKYGEGESRGEGGGGIGEEVEEKEVRKKRQRGWEAEVRKKRRRRRRGRKRRKNREE
jgi:hypothetical protein